MGFRFLGAVRLVSYSFPQMIKFRLSFFGGFSQDSPRRALQAGDLEVRVGLAVTRMLSPTRPNVSKIPDDPDVYWGSRGGPGRWLLKELSSPRQGLFLGQL